MESSSTDDVPQYQIFPVIGIARVGDSRLHSYIANEAPQITTCTPMEGFLTPLPFVPKRTTVRRWISPWVDPFFQASRSGAGIAAEESTYTTVAHLHHMINFRVADDINAGDLTVSLALSWQTAFNQHNYQPTDPASMVATQQSRHP